LPSLANTWEFTKPNEITFYLRKNIRFHDGTVFDASDVVESYALIKQHRTFGAFLLSQIQSVVAINQHEVKIILNNPDRLILRRMAFWFRIFPKNTQKSKIILYGLSLAGTGPWKFIKHGPDIFQFEHFSRYWDKLPQENTTLVVHTNVSDPVSLISGSNDFNIIDGLPWNSQLEARKYLDLNIIKTQANYSDFGIFNTLAQDSIIRDVRIRKAINLAINREALIRLVYEGNVVALSSLSLPNEDGHDSSLQPYEFNLADAQHLVDDFKTEHPTKPLTIKIGMQSFGKTYEEIEHFIVASLAQIGIKSVIIADYSVALQKQKYSQSVDLILGGDPSPYGHFDFIVQNFFVNGSIFQTVDDVNINALLQRISECTTEDQVNHNYEKIDRIIHNNY
jgi:ABC-type transport system substrate-binding protein